MIVEPHPEPDWTSRNWEAEAKAVSAVLKKYPELYNSRVTYRIVYATTYLVTPKARRFAPAAALRRSKPASGRKPMTAMPVHNFVTVYANRPGDLPAADAMAQQLDRAGQRLGRAAHGASRAGLRWPGIV